VRRLSADPATRTIPIVVVGRGQDGEAAEAYDAGASAAFPHTTGDADLVAHVASVVRRGSPKAGADEQRRQILLDLARGMANDRDPRAGLHKAVKRVAEATGAQRAGVLLLSAGGKRAFILAAWPLEKTRDRIAIDSHPALAKAVAETRWQID